MGCSPSFLNRRVVSLQYPTEKERFTTLGFISSTHASAHERTFQTENHGSGEIGTLLISLAIPVGQNSKKDIRDKRDREESGGLRRLMTLQEGSKEFSFKAVTESCSSVDPKEMTFLRQSGVMASSATSYRNSVVRVESRKNSNFLLARKDSEKKLRRLDTVGDSLQKTQSVEHLKIDNFIKSADELMYAFGSGNTLREENGGGTGTNSLAGSKVLLVVPEEGRHYESIRSEKVAVQSCHTSPKQYNNKNARHVRRISESKDKPPTPKHWPTLDFRFVRKESFNAQDESAYFGSPNQPEEPVSSKEFISPKTTKNSAYPEEKKFNELVQPAQDQLQLFPDIVMTSSLSQKRQAKLTLPFISNKSSSLPITTSESQEVLKNKPPTEVINIIGPSKPGADEEHSSTRQVYKRQRSNVSSGRFKSESGITIKPPVNLEESPLNNLKSKFRANLLDLVVPKRNSASHSVDTQKHTGTGKSEKTDGFDDCLDDISNISMRSMQKSPPISNIRERDAGGEIYFRFDSFDTDVGMISPICSPIKFKRDFSKTDVKIALQKLAQTSSPIESRIKSPMKSPARSPVKSPETSSPAESRFGSRSPSIVVTGLRSPVSPASPADEDFDVSYEEDDDNASNFDFDNYTFIEEAGGIEIDEAKGINIYDKKTSKLEEHLARLAQLKPHQSIKRSQFGTRNSILSKSKSVTYDVNTLLSVSPQKREQETEGTPVITPLNAGDNDEGNNTEGDDNTKSPTTTQLRRRQYLPSRRHSKSQVIEIGRLDTMLVEEEKIKRINQYEVGDEIGKGPIAEVYFGVDSETFKHYGIKIISKDKIERNLGKGSEDFEQMQTEVALLKKLEHPNIAKLYEVIDDHIQEKLFFISEFVNKEKTATQQLTEEKVRKYFRELLLGIDYLHNSANIVHGNIKPTNILISQDDTLKIVDCHVSPLIVDADTSFEGNDCKESYLPPEAFENEGGPKEQAADIWGLGSMLYYYVYGTAPFSAGNMHGLERKIREEEPEMPEDLGVNAKIMILIETCMAKEPKDRPSLKEIMQDPWVTKNGQEPLFNKLSDDITVTSEEVDSAVSLFTRRSSMSPNRFAAMSPSRFSGKRMSMGKGLELIEVIAESKEDLNMPETSLVIDDNRSNRSESP